MITMEQYNYRYSQYTVCNHSVGTDTDRRGAVAARYSPSYCFFNESAIQCPHSDDACDTGDRDVLLPHLVENGSGPVVDTWRENDEQ